MKKKGRPAKSKKKATRRNRHIARKSALPVFQGGSGLAAGIDPASNKSMLDAADS